MTRYEHITSLYQKTVRELADPQEWQRFLGTACWNYRLPFDEQVLLFAQRPDATAVLPIEKWQQKFGRWVNRGARGIAVMDSDAVKGNLKYFFDITDTHPGQYAKPVPIWTIKPEFEPDVIETLANNFGTLSMKEDLGAALAAAAEHAAADHIADYLTDLMLYTKDSFLEELDQQNIEVLYRSMLETSIGFMLFVRCGLDPESNFSKEDFGEIVNFNTPETLTALGVATGDIGKLCLSEIGKTVLYLQIDRENRTFAEKFLIRYDNKKETPPKQRKKEGPYEERTELHHAGRLQPAEPVTAAGSGDTSWEVRDIAAGIPEEASESGIHESADCRETESTSDGDRTDSKDPYGADGITDGTERGRERGTKRERSASMGRDDEQSPAASGGSRVKGPDLQLDKGMEESAGSNMPPALSSRVGAEHAKTWQPSLEREGLQQLSIFDSLNFDQPAERPARGSFIIPRGRLSQQVIDEALCVGANDRNSCLTICAYFMKDYPIEDNAAFLQSHYGINGAGFYIDDHKYAVWYDEEGMRIASGDTVQDKHVTMITWMQAAARIRELLDLGRYMPQSDLDRVAAYERNDLADLLALTARDFSEKAKEAGYAPVLQQVLSKRAGFPEIVKEIFGLLNDPKTLLQITTEWEAFVSAYEQDQELMRFKNQSTQEILVKLHGLQREQLVFTAAADFEPNLQRYITMDEIDKVLRGSEGYRRSVHAFFSTHPDIKDRVKHLKSYHGEYSGYYGGNDNLTYTGKGLSFSHGSITMPYAKVELSWNKIARRIDALIRQDSFFLPDETISEDGVELQADSAETSEKEELRPVVLPKPHRERMEFTVLHPEIPKDQRQDFRITNPELGYGTRSEKYAANVAAIRCLKQIEAEDRLATPEEQEILSQYVGWGGLADRFDEHDRKYLELKSLLDDEEYAAARASSLTAFYTSPGIIGAMYQALMQMGFQQGNILEPSCGIGNFIGMLPEPLAGSKIYGVEFDSISARIAQQLYQLNSITASGFEKVEIPDSFFDVAIGNVPFGDFRVSDKRYDKNHWLIHDYFFGKALDKVRPGGIIAFITSKGTMDKENSAVRKYLAQRADLIGAVRLPNNAFKSNKSNAGTEVTSDIIFLQKRDRMIDIEPDWVHLDIDKNGIRMNSYFVQHPEMILGEMVMEPTQFGMDSACKPYEGADLTGQLTEAIQNLHAEITAYAAEELTDEEDHSIPADPSVRNFSYTILDGTVYFRENSRMYPVEVSVTAENRIRGMIALRDCVRKLIEYQTEGYPDEDIQNEQTELNRLYDEYTKKYGLLSSRGNSLAFGEDSSYCLLCSLEVLDEDGSLKRKADMFTKRTIRPHKAVTSVDTASEALAVSIAEKARVDIEYMSALSGKTAEELETELSGVIFRDIQCAETAADISNAIADMGRFPFVPADEYLSGNVRRKLRMAKALQEVLPAEKKHQIAGNITALEAVQPVDLTAAEIGVRIGANWIPVEIYQQFMEETFGTGIHARSRIKVLRADSTGQWEITEKNADRGNVKSYTTYGSRRMNAYYILAQTLNQKDARVYDYVEDENGNKKPVLNKKETAIVQDRQELIKREFAEWIWKDIDRREELCRIYNETFNSIRPREYDGKHIRFSGMNPEITLRPHQVNAIAHIMYGGNTLLAHEVGAGKTFEMVAAAMEMKRLGLCSKSLVVVPNHIIEQWAAEWLQLYPTANILVATKKDFEKRNRRKFCGRIATGDYDAIIIGHSQFEKIPMSAERQRTILQQQINEIMNGIEGAKAAKAERYTVKQLERTRKSLETKLQRLNDQSRKDDLVTFEELGVDRIFIDESHYFKNLFLATKMRNVGGIAQTEAQKSSDLFMKCRYLDEVTGGRGVIFATGTPISNSMVELYTIQRYLQYSTLEEMGLLHFDDWASDFGETVTAIELSPEGGGYRAKTRFAKFFNLPELMSAFKMIADIQTADMLKLPVPIANFHTEVIQPSELQQQMVSGLAERAEAIRNGSIDPSVDNMLKITNDGRKLALDMRLINPLAADDPNGKVAACARNVYRIWKQTGEQRSTQLVFCDLSTPKGDGMFNVYDDLRQKLMDTGIPEEEIAYIHHANTEVKKKELFARVRSGQVRVLMGSTQKMGAGTNVQDKLIALHDLDCPWRPSDLSQRLGRIVRQGNKHPEVEIYRYVTAGTFDAYLYQLVENKQKFVAQIMTSKAPVRIADDVDETALSYSEIKALATGNPLIVEKCNLDMEVDKLNMLKASHLSQKYALEELVLRKYPADITRLMERIAGYEQDVQLAAAHPKSKGDFPGMTVFGKMYGDKAEAGRAIISACAKVTDTEAVQLGQYRGFAVDLTYDAFFNEYQMMLKGTLTHTLTIGTDIYGNFARMDHVIDGLTDDLEKTKAELADIQTQLASAKSELQAPFTQEKELKKKTARLKEVNILLNLNQKESMDFDDKDEKKNCARDRGAR